MTYYKSSFIQVEPDSVEFEYENLSDTDKIYALELIIRKATSELVKMVFNLLK